MELVVYRFYLVMSYLVYGYEYGLGMKIEMKDRDGIDIIILLSREWEVSSMF